MAARARHPVVRLLVDALTGAPPALPEDVRALPVDDVLAVAEAHRVGPALARHLAGVADVPGELAEALRVRRTAQTLRHLRTLADVAPLARALDDAGIAWVVVKGPVAAADLWRAPDMREYLDVDVVVDPRRLPDAMAVLDDLGARQWDLNWRLIRRQLRGELTYELPGGTVLDLHWHPVNEAGFRSRLRWDVGAMLERRRDVRVGSLDLPTLDRTDTLLHMAYHAAHSGAYRLLWLEDVRCALAAVTDPEEVVRRAEDARLDVVTRVVLDRVALVLGDGSQASTLPWTTRRGAAWRWALREADRRTEVPRPVVSGRSRRTLFTSTRTGTVSSAGAFAAEGVGHVVQRRDSPRRRTAGTNPLHVPDGDTAARADYLARVVAHGR